MRTNPFSVFIAAAFLAGCPTPLVVPDSGTDSSPVEVASEVGGDVIAGDAMDIVDVAVDVGVDVQPDVGVDAPPPSDVPADNPSDTGSTCAGLADGSACGASGMICLAGACVVSRCGDGFVDVSVPEQCDDGNMTSGDGCDYPRCTYSCVRTSECDDQTVCNGVDTCDLRTHACVASAALNCNDNNACTTDACDPVAGCSNTLIDHDHDGHAPLPCGDDCDDNDPSVYPGAPDFCDNLDNNCNGTIDEGGVVTWYADCDRDGYAPVGATTRANCMIPADSLTGCGGTWVTLNPAVSADCNDASGTIHPNATETAGNGADENCDGREACYHDADGDGYRTSTTFASTNLLCNGTGEAPASRPSGDCADSDASVHPGVAERCNNVDDDCNGMVDDNGPWPSSDPYEPMSNMVNVGALVAGVLNVPASGNGNSLTPPGLLNFHLGDPADWYHWHTAYSSFQATPPEHLECRVTGMAPVMRVHLTVGVRRGGSPALPFLDFINMCPNTANGGSCIVTISNPRAGSDPWDFVVGVIPETGVSGCFTSYGVECRLTTDPSTVW